jgi:hypothetical protein
MPQNPNDQQGEFPKHLFGILGSIILVAILFVGLGYVAKFGWVPPDGRGDWGTFGDYVGGLMNPLIGILGFIGVIFTLHQQHKSLKHEQDLAHKEREDRERADRDRRSSEMLARLLSLHEKWDETDFKRTQVSLRALFLQYEEPHLVPMRNMWDGVMLEHATNIAKVYSFLARLAMLIEVQLIERQQVNVLLGSDLQEWLGYVRLLDFSDGGAKLNEAQQEELRRLRSWYVENVQPLGTIFKYPCSVR